MTLTDRDALLGSRWLLRGAACTLVAFDGRGKLRLQFDSGEAMWIWQTSQFARWVRDGILEAE